MKLTQKDLSSVAGNRVFKGTLRKLFWWAGGTFIAILAAGAISKTLTMVVALAAMGIYFMWMMKLEKDQKALTKELYTQAQAEGIQLEG